MPLGAAMPRHAPIVQSLPVAAFSVGTFGYSAAGVSLITARLFTLPASISERASGSEHGRDLDAAGDEVLQARRGAVRRHPGHGRRIDLQVLQHAGDAPGARCRPGRCPRP